MELLLKDSVLRATISPQEIRDLRHRLSPDPDKPLSQQRFSELFGVSWSTVARWEGGGRPNPQVARKLIRLRRALDALGEMVKPEYRLAFFKQHHPLLLNLRPIDLFNTDDGAETVIRLLEGAETGAFA
ncbi:MAG: Antitoxin component of bacterial toxin-antitoxin system, MqsA [Dehalococcoidia bacterium]|nr:Antitoxin component of bacterial toxin-antitoxin system, MqsA [Dehalococcoidia bacterium]